MLENQLKTTFNTFNYLSSNLIKLFTKNNLDEHSLLFLSKRTKHFLSFTHKIVIRMVFKLFKTSGKIKDYINEDIVDIDKMLEIITEQINKSLEDILNEKLEEDKQKDMDEIVDNLLLLKDIINSLSNFSLSIIKHQTDIINDDELLKDYRKFKYEIGYDKEKLNKKINN